MSLTDSVWIRSKMVAAPSDDLVLLFIHGGRASFSHSRRGHLPIERFSQAILFDKGGAGPSPLFENMDSVDKEDLELPVDWEVMRGLRSLRSELAPSI